MIDLARLVRRVVVENPKDYPYIFAIDKTRKPSQSRLIKAISKGIGTNKVANVQADAIADDVTGWKDFLSINLKMKASDAFKAIPLKPEQEELEEAEDLRKANEFPWHAQKGIPKTIEKLNVEFNQFRGLNPVKIMITGPPASGKTFYADKLAKYYNIPKVEVSQLLSEVWRMAAIDEEAAGEDELINLCRTTVDELREKEIERMGEEYEASKKDDDDDFDPDAVDKESLKIRIPDDILYRLLQIRLAHNACRNRGYILDGFPRTHKDAQNCFLYRPKKYDPETGEEEEFEEEELEEGQEKSFEGFVRDETIFPSSCIVLQGQDDLLMKRVRDLTEAEISGTHYNQEDMSRRLKLYRTANNSQVAEPSVQEFFNKQGVKIFTESVTT